MARKAASTDKPSPKRQRGFAVVIKGFIPMGEGVAAQIATLQMIQGIEAGEFGEAVKHMVGVEVTSKQTSRSVAAE